MPFLIFIYISIVNAEYMAPLFNTTAGRILLAGGACLMGLGIVVMISITREAEFGNRFYFTGLILISMWGYGLSRLRFGYAVLANAVIIVGYEFATIQVKQLLASETGIVIFTMHNFFFLGANIVGMFTSYALQRYTRNDFLQELTIQAQRDQADSLLYNVLPEGIAERVKQSHDTIAEEYESASVLFADIVNFTPISARFGPLEVVEMLNELFSSFDDLVDKFSVEKIQVAGDGYMVAGGLPVTREDHCDAVVSFALDMLDRIKRHQAWNHEPIHLRVGIDTGPVVAGVIGRHKFIYDLWGDAVNTASRMESNGLVDVIQVTEAVKRKLDGKYTFEQREPINIKGKGQMVTYLLRP